MLTTFTKIHFNLKHTETQMMKYQIIACLSTIPHHLLLSSRMKCKPKDNTY